MRISDRLLVTSTVNAPFFPSEGRMVPERKVSESTCLKMTLSPKHTCCLFLLNELLGTFRCGVKTDFFLRWTWLREWPCLHFFRCSFTVVCVVRR